MEKKMLFIYSPVSGKGHIKSMLSDVLSIYTKGNYCVTVHPTAYTKDGYDYIRAHANEYDLISVCGGDGMLNEAVSALMTVDKDKRPTLTYIPCGSTNDFAGTIGLPSDIRLAAKVATEGAPFCCDAGMLNDSCFAYVAAFGAFTSVAYDTAQEFKNVFGHLAYVLEGIRQLPSIKPIHLKITYDSNVIEDNFLLGMVTNSLQVGGMKFGMGSAVSLNDGMFEVLLIKCPQGAIEFQNMLTGFISHPYDDIDGIIRFKASSIVFESDTEISWTLDGEFGGSMKKSIIKIIPRAFAVML